MKKVLLLLTAVFLFACGTQKQLQKAYVGKTISEVKEKFGEPKTILDNGEEKVYIFEISEKLESTEISQGKLTLDPIVTPKVTKTERFYFTVKEGKVVRTKFEEAYERKRNTQ